MPGKAISPRAPSGLLAGRLRGRLRRLLAIATMVKCAKEPHLCRPRVLTRRVPEAGSGDPAYNAEQTFVVTSRTAISLSLALFVSTAVLFTVGAQERPVGTAPTGMTLVPAGRHV